MTGPSEELSRHCEAIEGAYEFMLAYAGQGLPRDQGSKAGAQIREHLRRMDDALGGLADLFARAAAERRLSCATQIEAFLRVLRRDADASQAAVQLTLAQPSIGSQLVDNLNASIHLRALLTDLFLLDEILKSHDTAERAARAESQSASTAGLSRHEPDDRHPQHGRTDPGP